MTEYKKRGGGGYECQLTVNEGGIIGIKEILMGRIRIRYFNRGDFTA